MRPRHTALGLGAASILIAALFAPLTAEAQVPATLKQIIVVFKTHFDIGYSDMARNVVHTYRTSMIDKTLLAVEKNRQQPADHQFVWTLPGWPMTQILWKGQDPRRRQKIDEAVRSGSLVFHALPFSTHTETLELEDLVRGLGFSSRLARSYGLSLPRDAKMTDVPSHTWLLPTLLKHAGIEFFHIGCNDASEAVSVPMLFWWEGPDGSRLLTMFSHTYGTALLPPKDWAHGVWLALLHTSDNVGPPKPEYVSQVLDQLHKEAPGATVKIGRMSDFSDAILAEKPELPVVRGDMPDSWIHGPMSAPAGCKIARNTRLLMAAAEALNTLERTWRLDVPDARETLSAAYEKSLLYGEHTWGLATQSYVKLAYGTEWDRMLDKGLGPNYRLMEESWDEHEAYIKEVRSLVNPLLDQQLQTLARNVKVKGRRIVVFNPLPWNRSGLVTAGGRTNRFVARDVPALGYRTYVKVPQPAPSEGLRADSSTGVLESPYFRAIIDPARGVLTSLIDKGSGREMVDRNAPHGFGQYLYERFGKQDVANYIEAYVLPRWRRTHAVVMSKFDMPDAPYSSASPANMRMRVEESATSVSAVLTAVPTGAVPHKISMRLTLYRDLPVVDLELALEKKPDGWPEAGWICLPLKIDRPSFRLGRVGSIIDPVTDVIEGSNFHLFWLNSGMTVTGPDGRGVGLCPIDTPAVSLGEPGIMKYSRRYVPTTARVYVNLFNNQWHTNFRSWWGGSLSSRVRLWSVANYQAGPALYTPSMEARVPLQAVEFTGPAGKLPLRQEGLRLSRDGVALTAFGPDPDGEGTILRLWEQAGRAGPCTVTLPASMKTMQAQPIDLRGRPSGEPMAIGKRAFTVTLKAYAPASFRLRALR